MGLRDELAVPVRGEQVHSLGVHGPPAACSVDHRVPEHVRDGVGGLRRGAELVRVIAIRKHLPAAFENAVHGFGDADGQRLHATSERDRVARLDDQVQMVRLHGEVDEAEAVALTCAADAGGYDPEAGPAA